MTSTGAKITPQLAPGEQLGVVDVGADISGFVSQLPTAEASLSTQLALDVLSFSMPTLELLLCLFFKLENTSHFQYELH